MIMPLHLEYSKRDIGLNRQGKLQNFIDGPEPDNTSVILRVNPDNGYPAKNNPFLSEKSGNSSAMSRYFAYGIRNSFGLAFDPVTHQSLETNTKIIYLLVI
jgi:aldose sugar dehydrogenase